MKKIFYRFKWEILLFLLAVIVRLPQLFDFSLSNFPEFYRDYFVMEKFVLGHIPLLGPPSMQAHFYFAPIYYYLFFPLFFLFKYPASLILTGIILYAISTVFFYRLLLLWLNNNFYLSFLGATFYAISIYSLHLTSYVSNPNFLPLFVVEYFYYFTKFIDVENKKKYFQAIMLGLFYGCAAGLHTTAAVILPLASFFPLILVLIKKNFTPKNFAKYFCFFAAASFFVFLPYFWFEIASNFSNLHSLLHFGSQHLSGNKVSFGFFVTLRFFSASLNPFDTLNFYTFLQPNFLYYLVAICSGIFLIYTMVKFFWGKKSSSFQIYFSKINLLILFGWLFFGILQSLLFDRGLHDHYLIILWPLPIFAIIFFGLLLQKYLNITFSFLIFLVLICSLQIFSFYNHKFMPFANFFPIYDRQYKFNPETPNIGFSPNQNLEKTNK